ncbi:hypothetical protein CPB84DRAFT_1751684 [Gymnopilus junonius]|uniref:Uncharacterized protein n=1 Tax=Gymnopilus junonius TaxID=109634 RepID=A0A9P5ND71_GYMJU|nr:hypothetical protein CPB84DRAFT_1751684 [Gymnopilus junonius]
MFIKGSFYLDCRPYLSYKDHKAESCPTIGIFISPSVPPTCHPRDIFSDYEFVTSPPPPIDGIPANVLYTYYDFETPVPWSWKLVSEGKYWEKPDGSLVCAQPCGRQEWLAPECRMIFHAASDDFKDIPEHESDHLTDSEHYCKPLGCLCDFKDGKGYVRIGLLKRHLIDKGKMNQEKANKIGAYLARFERPGGVASPTRVSRRR